LVLLDEFFTMHVYLNAKQRIFFDVFSHRGIGFQTLSIHPR